MTKTRFALVGGGWRASFYARIAREMPDRFELAASFLRNEEKRTAWGQKWGGRLLGSLEELKGSDIDFVVLAVAKKESTPILLRLMELGIPILCETPPALTLDGLNAVWQKALSTGTVVQVAEQYPYQPLYSAYKAVIRSGMLGEVSSVSISTVHSYHAAAVIRFLLDLGFQDAVITGERFFQPVRKTADRSGLIRGGEMVSARRDLVTFRFAQGKTAFFDFSNEQYYSAIRNRRIVVQGDSGEIDGNTVCSINSRGIPVVQTIERRDLGVNNNHQWSHCDLSLGSDILYSDPFFGYRFNDDEIAVAVCMDRMGRLCGGEKVTVYPLPDALQDAYFASVMTQALQHPLERVETSRQAWAAGARD